MDINPRQPWQANEPCLILVSGIASTVGKYLSPENQLAPFIENCLTIGFLFVHLLSFYFYTALISLSLLHLLLLCIFYLSYLTYLPFTYLYFYFYEFLCESFVQGIL